MGIKNISTLTLQFELPMKSFHVVMRIIKQIHGENFMRVTCALVLDLKQTYEIIQCQHEIDILNKFMRT